MDRTGIRRIALLTGLAFAAPIQAFSAAQTNDAPFASLFRFVIMPMFIFSGTFFPISQLPELLQLIAMATPLWHAVSLSRGIALDMLDPLVALINVSYLSAFVAVGLLYLAAALTEHESLIAGEVLAKRVAQGTEPQDHEFSINGRELSLAVTKD